MTLRVLVVDDSAFIRRRVKAILEEDPGFEVVGEAGNGAVAIQMAAQLKPDAITMDVEMPIMDGITAVKKIMSVMPTPVLMFSAKTQHGAQATLDALNAGALDFLPKQLDDIDNDRTVAKIILRQRLKIVAQQAGRLAKQPGGLTKVPANSLNTTRLKPDLLLIAASTGGPVAIQQVLTKIPSGCQVPILILQHMPVGFTESFARRLDGLCAIHVKQASQHDNLKPGVAMICPGGFQLGIQKHQAHYQVQLREKKAGEIYSPCIDLTFAEVARTFSGRVLAVVLTGMGADGQQGARQLKAKGAKIWAQDEASSTIYGMPKAVADAGIADKILSLEQIGQAFERLE
jgi:two-component system chemotaxis response regulator CheB